MLNYRFTILGAQAPEPITVPLHDDASARDYGENIVRDLLIKQLHKCEAWTMGITQVDREVASIRFDLEVLREPRSLP